MAETAPFEILKNPVASVASNALQIDGDGLVRVWDIAARKWARVRPVDAREQIRCGTSALEEPKKKTAKSD